MEKLKMQTANKADENFKKLAEMFPNAVTEAKDENGNTVRAIDKDVLMQEINTKVVEGREERYQFTWPDKKKSILLANAPINKTLRPCREESVDFDNTENLYIEGDNLEVLKLLQETYLGKIKMIYIDPPYNTGNDFVYNDEFGMRNEEWNEVSGNYDEDGNQLVDNLVKNTENNGRFHTDWLNMIYPRLKIARDLLTDDGVIFISIDDNEQENLKKICDEVFGACNFVAQLATVMNLKGNNDQFGFAGTHEYTLVYIKNILSVEELNGIALTDEDMANYIYEDEIGKYKIGATLMRTGEAGFRSKRPKGYYPIYVSADYKTMDTIKHSETDIEVFPITREGVEMSWRRSPENLHQSRNEFVINHNANGISFYKKQRLEEDIKRGKKPKTLFYKAEYSSGNGTLVIKDIFNGRLFDNPKPLALIKDFIKIGTSDDSIILDFFSGSATTAHAVMQLNAEDGGNRKFIMVQLPEKTDEKSEAYKAGYKNICEIGKERIRRAGQKIRNEELGVRNDSNNSSFLTPHSSLDCGFRVLKLDTSNMKDVYYSPADYEQSLFSKLEDNIKEDRTPEDLLFQVMLDLGILLSSKIQIRNEKLGMRNYTYYDVADGYLIACFDENVSDETIKAIAKQKPYYFVMRDSSMASDSVATNFEQIFANYSPDTIRKVL